MPTIDGLSKLATGLAQLQKSYTKVDSDANGTLSLAEFEAAAKVNKGLNGDRGQTAATTFKQLDTNGSGTLTKAELSDGLSLTTQVQSVLLQGQELQNSYLSLLGGASTPSFFGGANQYTSLTSSLLGGGSEGSGLTSFFSGGNTGTSVYAGLFGGGGTNALVQQLISKYADTALTGK